MTKVVILCGKDCQIREGSQTQIKSLIPIGDRPVIQHIIDAYVLAGFYDFVVVVDFFWKDIVSYFKSSGYTETEFHKYSRKDYTVEIVETGCLAKSGSALRFIKDMLTEPFMVTYGDRISDVNNMDVFSLGKGTDCNIITAVHPYFQSLAITPEGEVLCFYGDYKRASEWVCGGYMYLKPDIFRWIHPGYSVDLERDVLSKLALDGDLRSFRYEGLWHKFDNSRDIEAADIMYGANTFSWIGKE